MNVQSRQTSIPRYNHLIGAVGLIFGIASFSDVYVAGTSGLTNTRHASILPNRMVSIMAREILNKPHPTPNPDGPHAAGSNRGPRLRGWPASQPEAEPATDEPNYDSCHRRPEHDLVCSRFPNRTRH